MEEFEVDVVEGLLKSQRSHLIVKVLKAQTADKVTQGREKQKRKKE